MQSFPHAGRWEGAVGAPFDSPNLRVHPWAPPEPHCLWPCSTASGCASPLPRIFRWDTVQGLHRASFRPEFQRPPPKKVILPLEMSLTDTEMEIIVFSLQHSKLQISDCVKQPPASHSKLQISDCAKQLPVSMCMFLNAASTWLGQKDEASNWELFI